jgi:hypothetical protein
MGVVLFSFLAACSTAGELVQDIQFTLSAENPHVAYTTAGGFALYDDIGLSDPDYVSGVIRIESDGVDYNYEIRGATFTLTPSTLKNDTSYPLSDPPLYIPLGWHCQGEFYGGATLTITGSIWHKDEHETPVFAGGDIIVAEIMEDWWADEESYPDDLYFRHEYNVTGGELATDIAGGAQTDWMLSSLHLINDGKLKDCSQSHGIGGTDLWNFGYDIEFVDPSTMQMFPSPEPATIVFLMLGPLMLRRRK